MAVIIEPEKAAQVAEIKSADNFQNHYSGWFCGLTSQQGLQHRFALQCAETGDQICNVVKINAAYCHENKPKYRKFRNPVLEKAALQLQLTPESHYCVA